MSAKRYTAAHALKATVRPEYVQWSCAGAVRPARPCPGDRDRCLRAWTWDAGGITPLSGAKDMFVYRPSSSVVRVVAATLGLILVAGCGGSGGGPAAAAAPPPSAGSPQAPTSPTGIVATPGDAQVSLTWSPSTGAASYSVKRATASSGPFAAIASPSGTSYVDTGLTNATTYYYVVSASNSTGASADSAPVSATPTAPPPAPTADVTVTVDPQTSHPISPWIYGINFATQIAGAGSAAITLDRAGGNRWTAYNWETNASNAGSDYLYENDTYLGSSTTAGESVRSIIAADRTAGMATLMTVQLQGLVAGDVAGPVSTTNPPDLTRFKTVVYQKGSAFTTAPSTSDANVYMDEFVWAMDQKFPGQSIFGSTPASRPVFLSLDNEPELWPSTHLEVQGSTRTTSDAYIQKTIALTKAIKAQFPNATIFGPVHYGFLGFYNWQTEMNATPGGADWFADKYLAAVRSASLTFGRPLVDVYDFHWYSEATDSTGQRVTDLSGPTLNSDQVQAIVQSPRSLWDASFSERSWITNVLGAPLAVLPRLQAKIEAANPGMRLAITEYNNGGGQHIAGTIAQADNLGIFGAQNLFAATYWPLSGNEPYVLGGFRAYRNFDGAGANFGDTSLKATSSNVAEVAAYVSRDSASPGRVVMVLLNRSTSSRVTTVNGVSVSGTARLFRMDASSASGQATVVPVAAGTQAASGASLTLTLPPLSVTTVDVR
jgi:hypothetical protein